MLRCGRAAAAVRNLRGKILWNVLTIQKSRALSSRYSRHEGTEITSVFLRDARTRFNGVEGRLKPRWKDAAGRARSACESLLNGSCFFVFLFTMLNGETQLLLREEYGFDRRLGWLGFGLVCLVERNGRIDVTGGLDEMTEDDMVIPLRSSLFRELDRGQPIAVGDALDGGMCGLREQGGDRFANRIVADGDFWGQLNFLSFKLKRNHKAPFATRISRLEEGLCLRGNRLSVVRDPVWVLGPRTWFSRRSA